MARGAKTKAPDTTAVDALLAEEASATPPTLSNDMLARITNNAQALRVATMTVERLEADTDDAKAEVRRLREQVLPSLMAEAQVSMLALEGEDGLYIERSEAVFASISKANANAACAWLDKNGYGSLIKTAVEVPLQRGDRATLKSVSAALTKLRVAFDVVSGVHNATLLAFVKESLAEGRKLPPEISVHMMPVVDLKVPKKRKAKKATKDAAPDNEIDMSRPF